MNGRMARNLKVIAEGIYPLVRDPRRPDRVRSLARKLRRAHSRGLIDWRAELERLRRDGRAQ